MLFHTIAIAFLLAAAPPTGVLLIGDSLMKVGVAPVLTKALAERTPGPVENKAKSATGLVRPDFYNWPVVARDLLKDGRFSTVVMFIGANDCQGMKDDSGVSRRFDSPEWRAVYAARVKAMAELLCEGGRKAYWLGLPPMQKAAFDRRIRRLDAFISDTLAASGTCVAYIPVKDTLGTKGKFAERLTVDKQRVRVRSEDGIHITQNGGALVANLLLQQMDVLPSPKSPETISNP